MKQYFFINFLIITSTSLFCNNPQFFQCPQNTEFEKNIAQLTEQVSKNEKKLTELLETLKQAQQEKEEIKKLRLVQAQVNLEQIISQQKIIEQTTEWMNNLPWYHRYSIIIVAHTYPWATNELWPTMKAILTNMIAQILVSQGLNRMDNITAGIPLIGFRFGENLTLNEAQKNVAAAQRILKTDPELTKLQNEIKKLDKQTMPIQLKQELERMKQNLETKKTEQALETNQAYAKIQSDVEQLKQETNAFTLIHDLLKQRDALRTKKEDILRYGTPTTSGVEEMTEENLSQIWRTATQSHFANLRT